MNGPSKLLPIGYKAPVRLITQGALAVGNVAGTAVSGVIGLVILTRVLPKPILGNILVLQSAVAVFAGVGRFGLDRLAFHRAAEYSSRRDDNFAAEIRSITLACLAACGISGILVAALTLWSAVDQDLGSKAILAIVITLWVAAEAIRLVWSEALRGLGYLGAGTALGNMGRSVLFLLVCISIGVFQVTGLVEAVGLMAVPSCLVAIIAANVLGIRRRQLARESGTRRNLTATYHAPKSWAQWLRTGTPLMLSSIASLGISQGDVLLVGLILGPTSAATYGVALRVANTLALPLYASAFMAAPHIAGALTSNLRDQGEAVVRRLTFLQTSLSLVALLLLGLFGNDVIGLVAGTGFSDGTPILLILMAGTLVNAATGPSGDVLAFAGQGRVMGLVGVSVVVATVPGGLIAGMLTQSMLSVAVVFSLGMAVQNVLLAIVARRKVGLVVDVFPRNRARAISHREGD